MPAKTLKEKLYDRLHIAAAEGCHVWTGPVNHDGYGRVWHEGRAVKAHVLAWMDATGRKVRKGCELDHMCENRRCCNPDHLDHCTHATNVSRIAYRPPRFRR